MSMRNMIIERFHKWIRKFGRCFEFDDPAGAVYILQDICEDVIALAKECNIKRADMEVIIEDMRYTARETLKGKIDEAAALYMIANLETEAMTI